MTLDIDGLTLSDDDCAELLAWLDHWQQPGTEPPPWPRCLSYGGANDGPALFLRKWTKPPGSSRAARLTPEIVQRIREHVARPRLTLGDVEPGTRVRRLDDGRVAIAMDAEPGGRRRHVMRADTWRLERWPLSAPVEILPDIVDAPTEEHDPDMGCGKCPLSYPSGGYVKCGSANGPRGSHPGMKPAHADCPLRTHGAAVVRRKGAP